MMSSVFFYFHLLRILLSFFSDRRVWSVSTSALYLEGSGFEYRLEKSIIRLSVSYLSLFLQEK